MKGTKNKLSHTAYHLLPVPCPLASLQLGGTQRVMGNGLLACSTTTFGGRVLRICVSDRHLGVSKYIKLGRAGRGEEEKFPYPNPCQVVFFSATPAIFVFGIQGGGGVTKYACIVATHFDSCLGQTCLAFGIFLKILFMFISHPVTWTIKYPPLQWRI